MLPTINKSTNKQIEVLTEQINMTTGKFEERDILD